MSRPRILVADDDPDVLDLHRLSLAEHFQLIIARDGREAWRLFESERPRLVVTDLGMPGISGLDLVERIREHPELGNTPVIILTGATRKTDLPPGFWKMGTRANAFLEKPYSPDALLAEIRRQLVLAAAAHELPPGKGFY